jgi:hypothetical protein
LVFIFIASLILTYYFYKSYCFSFRYFSLQGVLGIKVKIQLPHDPTGRDGVAVKLPDVVHVLEPKDEDRFAKITAPYAESFAIRENAPVPAQAAAAPPAATEATQAAQ